MQKGREDSRGRYTRIEPAQCQVAHGAFLCTTAIEGCMLRVPNLRKGGGADHAVHIAATHGDVKALKDVLKKEAGAAGLKDFRGWTPLLIASYYDRDKVSLQSLGVRSLSTRTRPIHKGGREPAEGRAAG
jgi:hypothetical protein